MKKSSIDNILKLVNEFNKLAKEEKKTHNSKAEVRNRGKVVFPAKSHNVKDDKDHFEINDIGQARNALARSHQYNKCPPWYRGSLSSLQEAVRRAVKKHYPSIDIGEKKSK